MNQDKRLGIDEKIKIRGEINLIAFAKLHEKYNISENDMLHIINYNNESEIYQIFEKNIENYKYFNVILFNLDNKEDAFGFLKSFIENNNKNFIIKNNSDYPFFVFFQNENFNKKLLYSYYLKNSKEIKIKPKYAIKSHNIIFIEKSTEAIKNLLMTDITNYFYEYDFKPENNNCYNIEILFMGPSGCGKSTFINYLLGKLRAYSASSSTFKSKGGVYTHSKYPITITDSEGFEISDEKQQEIIFKKLEKNVDEELNNRTHIAFYLVPGPFDMNRGFDYSMIGPLLKLEKYHIHYYVVMTKDEDESEGFSVTSSRFLSNLIKSCDYYKIKHDYDNDKLLTEALKNIKNKIKHRMFSVDVLKKNSTTIKDLFEQIYKDLEFEKKSTQNFIDDLKKNSQKSGTVDLSFSGDKILGDSTYKIPEEVINSPFFNLKKVNNNADKAKRVKAIIKDAQDISSIRKIFFCYNSKVIDNRKKMLKEILQIYECPNLTINLMENKLSSKEKDEWFYQNECTEDLGNKIIEVCEEEYKKASILNRYIGICTNFIESINKFKDYQNEFLNFNLDGEKIPYDCELNVN